MATTPAPFPNMNWVNAKSVAAILAAMLVISTATTITGVLRNTMRASRTIWTRETPGIAATSGPIDGGNRIVLMTMFCDGMMKSSGFSAVSIHPMIEL